MTIHVVDGVARPRVLLIDVDNMVGVACTPRPVARARMEALLVAAGPVHHAVAAYNARTDQADDPLSSHLAELGVGCIPVDDGPDAADHALLRHARRLHDSRTHGDFVVASADGRFSQLASLGELEVLAWQGQPVAARLRHTAHRLRRVPKPAPLPQDRPSDRPVRFTPPRTPVRGPVDDDTTCCTAQSRHRAALFPAGRAAAALGVAFVAGIGSGVGKRLVDRLSARR
ncbi:hypothetical protein [Saccharothrix xinjiangensis]|uniref:NYN domain-containing protein n=1 Tax=Saccharothrix xinjiangensis TaxID=204798 RepID=A0ABV9XVK5_9PSEU